MPVVDVRKVRMLVDQRAVRVGMGVGLHAVPSEIVCVLVMLVVSMTMRMLQRFVSVLVFVSLPDVQPHAQHHERCGKPEQE